MNTIYYNVSPEIQPMYQLAMGEFKFFKISYSTKSNRSRSGRLPSAFVDVNCLMMFTSKKSLLIGPEIVL